MNKKFIPKAPFYIRAFLTNEEMDALRKEQKKWDELAKAARIFVDKFHKKLFGRKEDE